MKPILIFAEEKDGTIKLTKEEIQRVVDEAYRQGKQDGSYTYSTPRPITVTHTWAGGTEVPCNTDGMTLT